MSKKSQRAAIRIAANLASGDVPRESSKKATAEQLGVVKPTGRGKALAAEILAAEGIRR